MSKMRLQVRLLRRIWPALDFTVIRHGGTSKENTRHITNAATRRRFTARQFHGVAAPTRKNRRRNALRRSVGVRPGEVNPSTVILWRPLPRAGQAGKSVEMPPQRGHVCTSTAAGCENDESRRHISARHTGLSNPPTRAIHPSRN